MAPRYTLYYYKLHARGEPIRMLFHYVEQRFEEVNWEVQEFPTKWKSRMPLKQAPMLEVELDNGDRWRIAETTAILRYLAGVLGIQAYTYELRASIGMFGEYISSDIWPLTSRYFDTFSGEAPVKERAKLYKTTYAPTIAKVGETVEMQLKKNANGFLAGPKISWVDFLLAGYVQMMRSANETAFNEYPLIVGHHEMIYGHSKLEEYMKKRPNYAY